MSNEIKLKIVIDGKDANVSLSMTEELLKEISKQVAAATEKGSGIGTSIASGLETARNSIQGLRELAGVVQSLAGTPVRLFIDDEQARMSFQVMIGDAEKATATFNELKRLGADTPLEFAGIRDASVTLMQFGVAADDLAGTVKMLGDVSGGNSQRLQQLALVFGQVKANGKLMGQDLMQLINAGFNPLQVMADKSGRSMGELRKEMESGNISFDDMREAFLTVTSEGGKFFGMMETQSETLGGRLSTLNDNIAEFQIGVGGSIATTLAPVVSHTTDLLNAVNHLPAPIKGVAGILGILTAAFVMLRVTGIGRALTDILQVGPSLLSTQRAALATIPPVTGLGTAFRAAGLAAKNFIVSLGPVGWAILGLTAAAEIFALVSENAEEAKDRTVELEESFKGLGNDKMRGLMTETANQIARNGAEIARLREQYRLLSTQDVQDSETAKKARERMATLQSMINERLQTTIKLQQFLNDLKSEYNRRNEAELKSLEEQATAIAKQAEIDAIGDAGKRDVANTKARYDEKKEIIRRAMEENVMTQAAGNTALRNLDIAYSNDLKSRNRSTGNDNRQQQLNRNIEELKDEKEHQKRLKELYGASKSELLVFELEFLEQKKLILESQKRSTLEVVREIELKRIEFQKESARESYKDSLNELQAEEDVSNKLLELMDASQQMRLNSEISFLERKLALQKQYGEITIETEEAIRLRMLELQAENGKAGTMDSLQKEQYQDELDAADQSYEARYNALDKWKTAESAKYKDDAEAQTLIDQVHAQRRQEIADQEAEHKMQVVSSSLGMIAGLFGQQTAAYKLLAIAQATMDTYRGAAAALAPPPVGAGPLFGPILAAATIAAGLGNVAQIMSVETPKMTAYATGGMALVGEAGPEIIAPAMDYAEGQAMLINAVINKIGATGGSDRHLIRKIDDLTESINRWPDRVEFVQRRGDLYGVLQKETRFRERNR